MKLKELLILSLLLSAMTVLGYHSLAFGIWQLRNPKANAMTFYSCYADVIRFRKLERFQ